MTDLSISIINYKTKELTAKCLTSIFNTKNSENYEVWVIDNASLDRSLEYLKKKFPKVSFIASQKNLGFAGGHNLALRKINSRYVLILNSDTEILENTLPGMVGFMDQNPDVGIGSCKVLGFDNKLQPNGGDLPFGLALLSWLFNLEVLGIKTSFHRNDREYYLNSHEVGWVSGNFMMVRTEVFNKVGLLNDDYFMYFEDSEFCIRARKKGFKVMINPEVSIKHLSGGSLDDPHFRQWLGEYKGLIKFYSQMGFLVFFIRVLIIISTIFRIIAFAAKGNLSYAKTYAKVIANL